jgi:hypothetical protein
LSEPTLAPLYQELVLFHVMLGEVANELHHGAGVPFAIGKDQYLVGITQQ